MFDVAADDVHPNAASGDVGDDFGGGKAGRENEIENVFVAEFGEGLRFDKVEGGGFDAAFLSSGVIAGSNPKRRHSRRTPNHSAIR